MLTSPPTNTDAEVEKLGEALIGKGQVKPAPARFHPLVCFILSALALVGLGFVLKPLIELSVDIDPREFAKTLYSVRSVIAMFVKPEPLERNLFILLTLSSPFAVLFAYAISKRLLPQLHGKPFTSSFLQLLLPLAGLALVIELYSGFQLLQLLYPNPAATLLIYAAAVSLILCAYNQRAQGWIARIAKHRFLALAVAGCITALIVLLPRGFGISTLEGKPSMTWCIDFQAAAYQITQVAAGKPALLAAPPLYGQYAVVLRPLFGLIGLSFFKICMTMTVLQILSMLCLIYLCVRVIRTRLCLGLCIALLLYCIGGTAVRSWKDFDPYFQYYPVRFLFPVFSILLFCTLGRRPSVLRGLFVGCFSGLALFWNLETGIAATAAMFAGLFAHALAQQISQKQTGTDSKRLLKLWFPSVIFLASTAAVYGLLILFLKWQAGWQAPVHTTADYQKIFYQFGFMMLPMPMEPHPWWFVVGIYLFALCFGACSVLQGSKSFTPLLTIYLGVLGTGLFTYYQGRSHDFNLQTVSWPAILLSYLFVDRLFRAIRAGLIQPCFCWLTVPVIYLGMLAVIMPLPHLGDMWQSGIRRWHTVLFSKSSGREASRIAFIRSIMKGKGNRATILAAYQAIYFAETGLQSEINSPGLTELFFNSDVEAIKSALSNKEVHHLFLDGKTFKDLGLMDVVRKNYKLAASPPDNGFIYLEPR